MATTIAAKTRAARRRTKTAAGRRIGTEVFAVLIFPGRRDRVGRDRVESRPPRRLVQMFVRARTSIQWFK